MELTVYSTLDSVHDIMPAAVEQLTHVLRDEAVVKILVSLCLDQIW